MTDSPPTGGAPVPHPDLLPELQGTFERFKQAVNEDDLDTLTLLLTGQALSHGKALREAVLTADRETLSEKDAYSKACVLGFRASFERDVLEALGYQGYFAYAVSFFPGGRQFLDVLGLEGFVASKDDEGEFVAGQLTIEGEAQDLAIHFRPSDGAWRIDPMALLIIYAHLTQSLVEHKFDGDDDAFLESFITDVFKPGDFEACWNPVAT